MYQLTKSIACIGKALLIKDVLVFSDVHVGLEEALNKEGFLVPRTLFKEIMKDTHTLLKKTKPRAIVIDGDFKHEFGRISKQEWDDTFTLTELMLKYTKDITVIKGNHDKILTPLTEKHNIKTANFYCIDDVYITHGDVIPHNEEFKQAKTIIIGHEHPCVTVRDDHKFEKFKTFLVGTYEDKELIVLPSFSPVEGADVTKERLLSPFLRKNKEFWNFDVYISAEEIYPFGKLNSFKEQ
jgi:putative SbcD/Mre11-related phosphoesterase